MDSEDDFNENDKEVQIAPVCGFPMLISIENIATVEILLRCQEAKVLCEIASFVQCFEKEDLEALISGNGNLQRIGGLLLAAHTPNPPLEQVPEVQRKLANGWIDVLLRYVLTVDNIDNDSLYQHTISSSLKLLEVVDIAGVPSLWRYLEKLLQLEETFLPSAAGMTEFASGIVHLFQMELTEELLTLLAPLLSKLWDVELFVRNFVDAKRGFKFIQKQGKMPHWKDISVILEQWTVHQMLLVTKRPENAGMVEVFRQQGLFSLVFSAFLHANTNNNTEYISINSQLILQLQSLRGIDQDEEACHQSRSLVLQALLLLYQDTTTTDVTLPICIVLWKVLAKIALHHKASVPLLAEHDLHTWALVQVGNRKDVNPLLYNAIMEYISAISSDSFMATKMGKSSLIGVFVEDIGTSLQSVTDSPSDPLSSDSSAATVSACNALARCCSTMQGRDQARACGAVTQLMQAMQALLPSSVTGETCESDTTIKAETKTNSASTPMLPASQCDLLASMLAALAEVVLDGEGCQECVELGGVALMKRCLEQDNSLLQEQATLVLAHLFSSEMARSDAMHVDMARILCQLTKQAKKLALRNCLWSMHVLCKDMHTAERVGLQCYEAAVQAQASADQQTRNIAMQVQASLIRFSPSLAYWNSGVLSSSFNIAQVSGGFVDVGDLTTRPIPLADMRKEAASFQHSYLLIDGQKSQDQKLHDFVQKVQQQLAACRAVGEKEKLRIAAKMCSERMGGAVAFENLGKFSYQPAIASLKHLEGSNLIRLGDLTQGVGRHRALLFRFLCDELRLAPCELRKGPGIDHAYNIVQCSNDDQENVTGRFVVDLLHTPGSLHPVDSVEACKYQHIWHPEGPSVAPKLLSPIRLPNPQPDKKSRFMRARPSSALAANFASGGTLRPNRMGALGQSPRVRV
jgi:hypothetical protein